VRPHLHPHSTVTRSAARLSCHTRGYRATLRHEATDADGVAVDVVAPADGTEENLAVLLMGGIRRVSQGSPSPAIWPSLLNEKPYHSPEIAPLLFRANPARVLFISSGLAVMAVSLSIIGLQEVGNQLSDPFGTELVDFSVMSFVTVMLASTRRMVARPRGQGLDPKIESTMAIMAHKKMAEGETLAFEESLDGYMKTVSNVFPPLGTTL
jgi:hypothetical protein